MNNEKITENEKLGAIIAVIPGIWLMAGAFHLVPIMGEFQWWSVPWLVTVVLLTFIAWGYIAEWIGKLFEYIGLLDD